MCTDYRQAVQASDFINFLMGGYADTIATVAVARNHVKLSRFCKDDSFKSSIMVLTMPLIG